MELPVIARLKKELADLKYELNVRLPKELEAARAHGDLSENAEYEDAKNEQAFVEGRIQSLEALLKNAILIDEHHSTDHVQIGSTVTVESVDGKEKYTIVGSAEASPPEGRISNESPLGRTLLGKRKGDTVMVSAPAGELSFKITGIS